MSRDRSAGAVLAGAAVIALAGCGSAAGTSPAAPPSPAGSASSPAGAAGAAAAATPAASPGSTVATASTPFPAAVGNTWIYDVKTNLSQMHALDTKRVVRVRVVPDGRQVTLSDSLGPAGSAINTVEHYLFYDNGQIGFPVSDAHGVSVVSSNGVVWPDAAGVASGRPYHSVLNVKLSSGRYETANVIVQGGGTQPVSVPAGTYQATLVTMTMVMRVGNFTSTAVVKAWTTAGTGPVKTEQLISTAGKTELITTSALLSFTKQAAGS
jgi:hypothetical protein